MSSGTLGRVSEEVIESEKRARFLDLLGVAGGVDVWNGNSWMVSRVCYDALGWVGWWVRVTRLLQIRVKKKLVCEE